MAAPDTPRGSERLARRELRVVEVHREDPRDACLVLVDRGGGADFESAANGAAAGTDMRLRVLTVTASDARDPRYPVGDMCFGGGAWWSTIVRDVLEEVDEEIIVFLEISSLVVFDAAAALADELAASDAAAIAARVLDSRGITIVFDRGRFSPIAHRDSDHRGFVATSVPMRQRPTLFFDGRAFAARRSTLLEVGPPDEELQDQLGDVDWCWRLWLAGRHVITSGSVSVLEHAAAADATRGAAASMQRARRTHAAQRLMAEVLEQDNLARAFALSAAIGAADVATDSSGLTGSDPRAITRPGRARALDSMALPAALHEIGGEADVLASAARGDPARPAGSATTSCSPWSGRSSARCRRERSRVRACESCWCRGRSARGRSC